MGVSNCLPSDPNKRRLLGEYFRRFNYQPRQEDLDIFVVENPSFDYDLAALVTKRRTLLSARIFDPTTPEEEEWVKSRAEEKKKKRVKPYHPAERHYAEVKAAERKMRGQARY